MNHTDFQRAILADPGNDSLRQMYADWLDEQGWGIKSYEAWNIPIFSQFIPSSYRGSGIGSGSGSGSGRGSGRGSGIGRGIGIGIGRGSGRGIGRGRGSGIGSNREEVMEIGQVYLIETVDWFAWVGRVKKQVGPWEYEFVSASKISETNNGDNWHNLAAGDKEARRAATYKHYKETTDGRGIILGMGVVNKIPWEGLTPQEAGLPGT